MTHNKRAFTKWSIALGLVAAAAVATPQFIRAPGAPLIYDRSYGMESVVYQLMSHAQLLETEVLNNRRQIEELKKSLEEEKEKAAKLEKRVRNMELRGK
jgi:hypothetical protein